MYHSQYISNRDHVVLFLADKFLKDESGVSSFEISASQFSPIDNLPVDLDEMTRFWLAEALAKRSKQIGLPEIL